ncbi:hypothetical protein HLH17_16470 [Acinetobacter sp. ANC 5380]|uniref:Uncharacterized protein n=1 Tax=Acinetobacter terrae TaxID=2731247 RepID=A0A7Y2RID3_9GAMM|nr:hypothetical protein [Acinetobacter terrae]NNH79212.1 hypothetical protein [Acinetobacter terrae]
MKNYLIAFCSVMMIETTTANTNTETSKPVQFISIDQHIDYFTNADYYNADLLHKEIIPFDGGAIHYYTFKKRSITNIVDRFPDAYRRYVVAIKDNYVKQIKIEHVQLDCSKRKDASQYVMIFNENGEMVDSVSMEYKIFDNISNAESTYCNAITKK